MVIVVMAIVIIIVVIVNIITIVIIVILTMGGCGLVGTSVVLGPAVDQRFETTPIKIRDGCRTVHRQWMERFWSTCCAHGAAAC